MNRVQRQGKFWEAYGRGDERQRKALSRHATASQVDSASELVYNFLRGAVPVRAGTMARLKPHRTLLRRLGDASRSEVQRRRLFQKGGSALGTLLQGVGTAALSGAVGLVNRNKGRMLRAVKRKVLRKGSRLLKERLEPAAPPAAVPVTGTARLRRIAELERQLAAGT